MIYENEKKYKYWQPFLRKTIYKKHKYNQIYVVLYSLSTKNQLVLPIEPENEKII